MSKFKFLIAALFFLSALSPVFAQQTGKGYFVIKDNPGELSMKVNLWGFINAPGRYEIPISTNLIQLITYAGGPKQYAEMDEVKIYRLQDDGSRDLIEVNIEDPDSTPESQLRLYDEDTIVIDHSAVVTWKEIFSVIYAPLSLALSMFYIIDRISR